jgi:hypothetical protein
LRSALGLVLAPLRLRARGPKGLIWLRFGAAGGACPVVCGGVYKAVTELDDAGGSRFLRVVLRRACLGGRFMRATPAEPSVAETATGATSMPTSQPDGKAALDAAYHNHADDLLDENADDQAVLVATAATVAVVGVGVAVFEAALLPGVVLGVAAMLVPKYLPRMGTALNPLLKSTVRGVYKAGQKTRELVAEAQEHVHDIVAEVDAEEDFKNDGLKKSPGTTPPNP